jgi:hypothetical protein
MFKQTPKILAIGFALHLTLAIGCGDGKQLATVEGTITKNGQPQKGIWVRFSPVGGGRPGEGRTNDQGHYEITYTAARKGAHVGSNKVLIGSGGELDSRGNELSPPVEIMAREVEVGRGSNTIDFELTE